ncbi:MAG: fumarylacetoacetate hydrolase family protein [Muribaculaceae bacterium]|nr:fumarylacetoacetate hydrolase family protein [Muribaculaceae bacterium]
MIRADLASGISGPVWTLVSPSAILQGGNPYFVPDFDSLFEARMALALRIGKLGKGIAPRFAHRYVDAVAPAVVFVAANCLERSVIEGLPWTSAVSYDRSLALGRFRAVEFGKIPECPVGMTIESEGDIRQESFTLQAAGLPVDETLAALSVDNTLKTGDIILAGLPSSGPQVSPGQTLRLSIFGEESLRFNIR